jgi:hypothetical protein
MESNIIEPEQKDLLLDVLSRRFAGNMGRHPGLQWDEVLRRLEEHPEKFYGEIYNSCTSTHRTYPSEGV